MTIMTEERDKYDALERKRDILANELAEVKRDTEERFRRLIRSVRDDTEHARCVSDARYDALERQRDVLANELVATKAERDEAERERDAAYLRELNNDAERAALCDRIVELKREVEATQDMVTQVRAELGIANRRIVELDAAARRLIDAGDRVVETCGVLDEQSCDAAFEELRRVTTRKGT
jgi:chromosome segregation ATPase